MMRIVAGERGATVCAMDHRYCVDNGAMIAQAGLLAFGQGQRMSVEEATSTQRFRTDELLVEWHNDYA